MTTNQTQQATEVVDLGEDTEAWIVIGTTDIEVARIAAEAHVRETCGDDWWDQALAVLAEAQGVARDDWWWQERADGDMTLCYPGDGDQPYAKDCPERDGEPAFVGVML